MCRDAVLAGADESLCLWLEAEGHTGERGMLYLVASPDPLFLLSAMAMQTRIEILKNVQSYQYDEGSQIR
jgi:hypothetical protein